jgi:NAD(P)H dehydrogenase (quinone)
MKHAVVVAHPNSESFTHAASAAYAKAAESLGHQVIVRDLYRMGFDPCLKAFEIPGAPGFRAAPDVVAERELLSDVDVFAFFYPFWFNAPPAILKGYADRIFCMGFGFEPAFGGTSPLLSGRKLISFSFSGAPDAWVRETHALEALMTVFDRHLGGVTGLRVVDHLHIGAVAPNMTADAAQAILADVASSVDRHFS